jgi:uncharacterized protein (TIGR00369 family)
MDADAVRARLDEALAIEQPGFGNFFILRFLGLDVSYDDDAEVCIVRVPFDDHLRNPQGTLHGGIVATAADISMGHLCHRFLSTSVTLEMGIRFLSPITGPVRCEGRFLKKGRTAINVESRVLGEDDKLHAIAQGTWFRLPQKQEGQA